jgi:hypothetical protein
MARPSSYNEATAEAICSRLAEGESLRKICSDAGMPNMTTVFRWLGDEKNDAFRKQYTCARETGMEAMAEDILRIADSADGESYNYSRLQVDTRKWLMSKMAPKKYGDKVENTLIGANGGAIQQAITVQFVKTGTDGS